MLRASLLLFVLLLARAHFAQAVCGDGILDVGELCDTALSACCAPGCLSIKPAGTECRASVGGCDLPEVCTGMSAACPADVFRPAGYECRPISMGSLCDVPEFCNGVSPYCPIDLAAPNTTVCRAPGPGLECVQTQHCPGTLPSQDPNAKACPADVALSNQTSCRYSCAQCDVTEYCPGPGAVGQFACPTDYNLATTTNTSYYNSCTLRGRACATNSCNSAGTCTESISNCIGINSVNCPAICKNLYRANFPPHITRHEWNRCIQDVMIDYDGLNSENTWGAPGFTDGVFRLPTQSGNNACSGATGGWTCDAPVRAPRPSLQSVSPLNDHCYISGAFWFSYPTALSMGQFNIDSVWTFQNSTRTFLLSLNTTLRPYVYADLLSANPANTCQMCSTNGQGAGATKTTWDDKASGAYCLLPESLRAVNNPCGNQALGAVGQCQGGVCVPFLETNVTNWGRVCRPAAGPCDEPEYCSANGTSTACPPDAFKNNTQICRASAGSCDIPEYCNGQSTQCPADQVQQAGFTPVGVVPRGPCEMVAPCDGVNVTSGVNGTVAKGPMYMCRPASGPCDAPEFCPDPNLVAEWWLCPADQYYNSTQVCRASAGLCDPAEYCSGSSPTCDAPNLLSPNGTVCRSPAGLCDLAEVCNGTSPLCPADTYAAAGTTCRAIMGPCDLAEQCNGTSPACPSDAFVQAGAVCLAARGPCEGDHKCSGSAAACPEPAPFNSTVQCRMAAGVCDAADFCPGNSYNCSADAKLALGTVCRAAVDLCDLAEVCNGTANACPADAVRSAGSVCHAARGPCEIPQQCNGVTTSCPAFQFHGSSVTCRASAGACDVAEVCDPFAAEPWLCPTDAFRSAGFVCAPSAGACSDNGVCSGTSSACPGVTIFNSSVVCRPAQTQCDQTDYCDGVSQTCPQAYLAAGTPCVANPLNCTVDECDGAGACEVVQDNCDCMADVECALNTTATCFVASCVDGFCVEELAPGFCYIDGQCYGDQVQNPATPCLRCDAQSVNRLDWAFSPSSTPCNTGNATGLCSAPDTCDGFGVCVDNFLSAGTVCRAAASLCDSAEQCTGSSDFCPADAFAAQGTLCRNATGPCDLAEYCDNMGQCPSDAVEPAGTVCLAARGVCEESGVCDGANKACGARLLLPSGTQCRAATLPCDVAEVCDGASYDCPADAVQPGTHVCRLAAGPCDQQETCNGLSKLCPADALFGPAQLCRMASGSCEYDGYCTQNTTQCEPVAYKPSGTVCQSSSSLCAVSATCDGSTSVCPALAPLPNGTQCFTPRGPCEGPGFCNGVSLVCQTEGLKPAGTVCRASMDPVCDPQETCNPALPSPWLCPADYRQPNGFPCPDAIYCNGAETCQSGLCTMGAPRNCSDGLLCTTDTCNEMSATCVHTPLPQIGTVCYDGPMGTADVGVCRSGTTQCFGNGTLYCANQVLPGHMEICGDGLDNDCDGAPDNGCAGVTCVRDSDCTPFIPSSCQNATCNTQTNMCLYPILSGECLIGGQSCVSGGGVDPLNPCRSCQPQLSQVSYTADNSQDPSDGNLCNGVEVCQGGQVVLSQPPLICPTSNNSCTPFICDGTLGCIQGTLPEGAVCSLQFPYACDEGISVCDVQNQCVCETGNLIDVRDALGKVKEAKFDATAIVLTSIFGGMFVVLAILLALIAFLNQRRQQRKKKKTQKQKQ